MLSKQLLISTRKGLVVYDRTPNGWQFAQTHFVGIPVSFTYVDPRNQCWWACLDHGHWGVKLHRSYDQGKQWEEIEAPKYPEGAKLKGDKEAKLQYIWSMSHGGFDRPNDLYVGTIPGGLFKSEDGGNSFALVESLWGHPSRLEHWFGGGFDEPGIDAIIIDPEDSDHLIVSISIGGIFESYDAGQTWIVRNKGLRADYLPDPYVEVGHDPHMLVACASNMDVMWQQNHCGVFRTSDRGKNWVDVSEKDGKVHFGFAVAVDATNPERAWVVPGISDEIRVAVDQALFVGRTEDGGKSWQHLRNGLPQDQCFDIVYRHALAVEGESLCFGTSTGNVYTTENGGDDWQLLNHSLACVYAVCFA